MIRFACAAFLALLGASTAAAQTAPSGWQVQSTQNSWIATSPPQTMGDRVRLVLYPAAKPSGGMEAWFNAEIQRRTSGMGTLLAEEPKANREFDPPAAPLFTRSRTMQVSGNNILVFSYGYETPKGRQIVQVVLPQRLGLENGEVQTALNSVASTWKSGVAFTPGAPATAPAQRPPAVAATPPPVQPTQPPQQQGKNCRREPVWGFRISPFCQPSGVCPDRVIKDYQTVCD